MSTHDLFSHVSLPKHKVPRNVFVKEITNDDQRTSNFIGELIKVGIGLERRSNMKSKIISHFLKGKVSLSPMEKILIILKELEYLESLGKLARRCKNEEHGRNRVATISPQDVGFACGHE
jgi:hypothetical protein